MDGHPQDSGGQQSGTVKSQWKLTNFPSLQPATGGNRWNIGSTTVFSLNKGGNIAANIMWQLFAKRRDLGLEEPFSHDAKHVGSTLVQDT